MLRKNKPSSSSSSSPFSSIVRSIRNFRFDQIRSIQNFTTENAELEAFQKNVTDQFQKLLNAGGGKELLSIEWIQKLLDTFVSCQDAFRVILLKNKAQLTEPRLARIASEYFKKSVKGLDICNASRDGVRKIKSWQNQLEIVLRALDSKQRALGQGQVRRARKALVDLTCEMLVEKGNVSVFSQQNLPLVRKNAGRSHRSFSIPHLHAWSVSRCWSAAKQIRSFANHLYPPRKKDIVATNGIAIAVFTMSFVFLFVVWTLVAALPCQDRGLKVHFSLPHQLPWSAPLLSLHERIKEESKKPCRRHSNGLLKEIHQIEKNARLLRGVLDSAQLPLSDEQREEIDQGVEGLGRVCAAFEKGLEPLEVQLREVFSGIQSFRDEMLDIVEGKDNRKKL